VLKFSSAAVKVILFWIGDWGRPTARHWAYRQTFASKSTKPKR